MKLVIVSHTPHYRKDGQIFGWGPTVREINHLAHLFETVIHIAPLHFEPVPASSLPYETKNISLRAVPACIGDGFFHYLDLILKTPVYVKTMLQEFHSADVIHVRCPAAISMIAVVLLAFMKRPVKRWIKYAGNWKPEGQEPWSYTFQRWCLKKNFSKSVVTVNGEWPDQPKHIHSFSNPCLTEEEIKEAGMLTRDKKFIQPVQFLFVGRLETEKGVGQCLGIAAKLLRKRIAFRFDFAGDGPERSKFEIMARDLNLNEHIQFHGWLSRKELNPIYARAHFMILPSQTEGWPKALSEAMAYGTVPLASAVGCIPDYLRDMKTGKTFKAEDVEGFAASIQEYVVTPSKWERESQLARQSSVRFSYENYLICVNRVILQTGNR